MTENLLSTGLMLAQVGMSAVFLFLGFLVVATRAMSLTVQRLDRSRTRLLPAVSGPPASDGADEDAELVAVLTAAVWQFRQDRGEAARGASQANQQSR